MVQDIEQSQTELQIGSGLRNGSVAQKAALLERILLLGDKVLTLSANPTQLETMLSLMQQRSKLHGSLVELNSRMPEQALVYCEDEPAVESELEIRARIARVIDQNTKLNSQLYRSLDWIKQKMSMTTGAKKFSRMYTGREYLNLLPHGLEVDETR